MNTIDKQYQDLLQDILDNGHVKGDRTGTGALSVFGRAIKYKFQDGKFPLLTTKKMHWPSIVNELLWFISGSSDIRDLWKTNTKIWDGDWYKSYKKSCSSPYELDEIKEKVKNGDTSFPDDMFSLGPIYGVQWRHWGRYSERKSHGLDVTGIDQLQNVMETLKTNPDSRRMMINAWNVDNIDDMTLPPCHYGFQVYTRELSESERYEHLRTGKYSGKWNGTGDKMEYSDSIGVPKRAISLKWNQRSVDVFLGLPFNIASYGLLLLMIADEMNMVPEELIGDLGDTHLYLNHIEQAKQQIKNEPFELPSVIIQDGMYSCSVNDMILINYKSHGIIKAPLSN